MLYYRLYSRYNNAVRLEVKIAFSWQLKPVLQAVRQRGAIVEAAAPVTLGSPSVNLLIEPTGAVKVLSTMEQIFCPAFRAVGHSFPQASVVHSALYDAASAIGKTLAQQAVIGATSKQA